MKITEYVTPLGNDGRRRTYHKRLQQNIIEFAVQYELFIDGKWYPVVRYDTVHIGGIAPQMSRLKDVNMEIVPA